MPRAAQKDNAIFGGIRIFKGLLKRTIITCMSSNNHKNTTATLDGIAPTWDALSHYTTPTWFREAKFGIYTHWGIFSVPAYGQNGTWYGCHMYRPDHPTHRHHEKTYGPITEFGYKDFIPKLTGEHFDADQWAQLFKDAGAQFAGPVAIFHDNFPMWNSKVNSWNAASMGPKRDVVGELATAIRGQGMKFLCTLHHSANYWWFPKVEGTDTVDPRFSKIYSSRRDSDFADADFLETWFSEITELIDGYGPDLMWFDFGLGKIPDRYRRHMLAYYYNWAQRNDRDVCVAFKGKKDVLNLPPLTGLYDLEVGKMNEMTIHPWLTDTSVDASPRGGWAYGQSFGYKSSERIIHNLIDSVSKNGYLLLNVGPRADGTIPEPAQDILRDIGRWLAINGEAIFGTVPWLSSGEGPTEIAGGSYFNENSEARMTSHDLRFTTKGDAIYITALGRPGDYLTCKSFSNGYLFHPADIVKIEMLGGNGEALPWTFDEDGLRFKVPHEVPSSIAVSFKLTLRTDID